MGAEFFLFVHLAVCMYHSIVYVGFAKPIGESERDRKGDQDPQPEQRKGRPCRLCLAVPARLGRA